MSQAHKHPEYLKNRGHILREQPICTVCNKAPSTQVDHITPIDAGGGHDPSNLRGICAKCNNTLAHQYVKQRNNTRNTIRADALRDNGIEIKPTRFFAEKNQIRRGGLFSLAGSISEDDTDAMLNAIKKSKNRKELIEKL